MTRSHSPRLIRRVALLASGSALSLMLSLPAAAEEMNDFPTLTRVEYVERCINDFDRPRQELIYKCTCAIDAIAKAVDHDTWVDLETFNNAVPIAGERGAYLRERKDSRSKVKTFRELQTKVRKACFLPEQGRS